MKTKTLDCPTCGADKSVKMDVGEIKEDGFTVKIFRCKYCNSQHELNKNVGLQIFTPSTEQ